jgi:dehydrogenase/reductase SDR family protein 1
MEGHMGLVEGRVVLVTGASRGIGRGIAHELGAQGAKVVVTARTVTSDQAPQLGEGGDPLPGTLSETVDLVRSTDAEALALPADLRDAKQIRRVIEDVISRYGRLDVLVNSAMGWPEKIEGLFWETPLSDWDLQHEVGLRSHYVAAYYAAPHMIRQNSGLIVNISSAASMDDFYNAAYRTAKAATDRLTSALAGGLRPHNVAAVSLWPRWVRTERVLLAARGDHPNFSVGPDDLAGADSPEFIGRAIAHLAADPKLMERSGQILLVLKLAHEYGFSDIDGALPDIDAYTQEWIERLDAIKTALAK